MSDKQTEEFQVTTNMMAPIQTGGDINNKNNLLSFSKNLYSTDNIIFSNKHKNQTNRNIKAQSKTKQVFYQNLELKCDRNSNFLKHKAIHEELKRKEILRYRSLENKERKKIIEEIQNIILRVNFGNNTAYSSINMNQGNLNDNYSSINSLVNSTKDLLKTLRSKDGKLIQYEIENFDTYFKNRKIPFKNQLVNRENPFFSKTDSKIKNLNFIVNVYFN